MKRLYLFLLTLIMLTGCAAQGVDTVEVDGVTYRTGYYGDLYVTDLKRSEEALLSLGDFKNFYRVEDTEKDLLITYRGGVVAELYCLENEWEDAKAYYENPDNFTYYCRGEKEFELENIDISKFNELSDFAKNNSYVPFNSFHNNSVKTLSMPIPDSVEYVFYKKSKDNLFTSSTGYEFLISDGKLILLFYYDHNHGESEPECIYVNVPEDLSNYFMPLISNN